MPDLNGHRVLLAGAESDLTPAIAEALTAAGARTALVALRSDGDAAFAVQRLARKTGAELSQAIDGTNDMAVRVMVRQVAKSLGGLDAVVACGDNDLLRRHGEKELAKAGGVLVIASENADATLAMLADALSLR